VSLYLSQRSPRPIIKILSSALLFIVPCDYLRLRWPGPGSGFARLYERCVGFLMRDSEKVRFFLVLSSFAPRLLLIFKCVLMSFCAQTKVNGVIWYIIGVNFALLVYPLDIAVVAILMYVSSLSSYYHT
jgi:diacylglycerol kinase (CTP)